MPFTLSSSVMVDLSIALAFSILDRQALITGFGRFCKNEGRGSLGIL